MKSQFKRVWWWIATGGAVVLLVCCVVLAFYPRAVGTNGISQIAGNKAGNPRPVPFPTNGPVATNQSPPQPAASLSGPVRKGGWDVYPQPGSYVMALARDGAGNIWAGTEGNGVWKFDPHATTNEWTQFTTTNGLGDDYCYSLAVDKQGRVWAGHLNHGVSVFNGTSWTNYDVPCGPIGERVFKIAVCPVDGDVWIGTSAGLTRYSAGKDEWINYTKGQSGNQTGPPHVGSYGETNAPGLPSDQISAIAFDAHGNIYVGTQCDGIAMAGRASDYSDWWQAPVADQKMPAYTGFGLPSKLINDLLVTSDGTVYAATDGGLGLSRDNGKDWQFLRGGDFPDKMRGLAGGPPKGWSAGTLPKNLLPEDDITCLAEDDVGVVWADFRQHGLLAVCGYSYQVLDRQSAQETGGADYGRAILPMPDFRPWLASYGMGLLRTTEARRLLHIAVFKGDGPEAAANAPFPSPPARQTWRS